MHVIFLLNQLPFSKHLSPLTEHASTSAPRRGHMRGAATAAALKLLDYSKLEGATRAARH